MVVAARLVGAAAAQARKHAADGGLDRGDDPPAGLADLLGGQRALAGAEPDREGEGLLPPRSARR
ncbi:hypothetical protein [Brachybacterium sp. GPGPB12]|uniref:hypothetical protein n=1 Tax=Brachybacterium sp. GPGPB12 TaxID=3023517 RepID=UPI0031346051